MINNVVLVGRLTKPVDLRYTANGTAVGSFTLAVNRSFTNRDGEREQILSIVSFGVKQLRTLLILLVRVH